eukprot:scaffold43280_cov51-Attheya_sp.AAC.1
MALNQRLTLLEQKNNTPNVFGNAEVTAMMGDPATEVLALSSAVAGLKDLVEKLEARQGSAGLFVADISFLSYPDTEAWVTLNLLDFRYGLYGDGHTLLENLMSAGHMLNTQPQSTKPTRLEHWWNRRHQRGTTSSPFSKNKGIKKTDD